jgi:hypothetical protein
MYILKDLMRYYIIIMSLITKAISICLIIICSHFHTNVSAFAPIMLKNHDFSLKNLARNANCCTKPTIEIDTVIINIYGVKNIHMTNSANYITMTLRDSMKNIFYINEEGDVEKITKNTTFASNRIKSIFAYELDPDQNIDCILYKQD